VAVRTERLIVSVGVVAVIAIDMIDIELAGMSAKSALFAVSLFELEALGPPIFELLDSCHSARSTDSLFDLSEFVETKLSPWF
jgi:hypothetical protein